MKNIMSVYVFVFEHWSLKLLKAHKTISASLVRMKSEEV